MVSEPYNWSITEYSRVESLSNGWQAGGKRGEQIGQVEAVVWSERFQCSKGDRQSRVTSISWKGVHPRSSYYTGIVPFTSVAVGIVMQCRI